MRRQSLGLAALWLLASCCLLAGCKREGPEPPPPGQICTWDVPPGQRYHFRDAPGGPDSTDFIARVYQATLGESCATFDDKPHPLVVIA
ncbi:MAG TPA: hypothetical protein VHS96_16445, partial [Bacteroidia bacterium]|nr:hypothetical protein [Bacteroidia bacterium]